MRRKSFGNMQCPIARSLERVGEWWSILILRDASLGLTRFDEFQESLGIAPNILTRRLKALVEAGLLERRRYSESRGRLASARSDRSCGPPAPARLALQSGSRPMIADDHRSIGEPGGDKLPRQLLCTGLR